MHFYVYLYIFEVLCVCVYLDYMKSRDVEHIITADRAIWGCLYVDQ